MRATLLMVILAVLPSPALATLIHVLPDGTGDVATIADALSIAVAGDSVSLGPGTYFEHDLSIPHGIALLSDTGDPATTIIDAAGLGRCLTSSVALFPTIVQGITLQGGTSDTQGGLVFYDNAAVALLSCHLRGGSAPRGGAVASIGTRHFDLVDCVLEGNEATESDGGAVWSYNVDAHGCDFVDNVAAGSGGAMIGAEACLDCTFRGNRALTGTGGAVSKCSGGVLIEDCLFEENSAVDGGALCTNEDFTQLVSCTFLANHASGVGGAMVVTVTDFVFDFLCSKNVFARNRAEVRGGAVAFVDGAGGAFDQNTFAFNEAPIGAHISVGSRGTTLDRCILAFAPEGQAISGNGTVSQGGSCNDVYGNAGGDFVGPLAGLDAVRQNFSADPRFCDPGNDVYTLQSDSPCTPPGPTGCNVVSGALPVGCGSVSIEETSWGKMKDAYR
ncbi:MAG: hypothetical protein R3B81_02490 [bacterium]